MTASERFRKVAWIVGEDTSPEVMLPSVSLLGELGLPIEWLRVPVGEEAKRSLGHLFPDEARDIIDASDATFFGSTSGPSAPALFYLRWGKQTFANVRPIRFISGARSPLAHPEGIDFLIVRENLEDMYVGIEGDVEQLAALGFQNRFARRALSSYAPARFALKVLSEEGSRRVLRFSFELARKRKAQGHAGKLAVGTKHNMLPKSDGYFREIAMELASAYPDIELESYIIDDFGQRLVTHPHELDVVVLPNLYGDIFSDTAAGLVGGLGLAASGCYGDDYAYFESAHGTAPDLVGKNAINPTATLLSAAMLLEYLGFEAAGLRLRRAIDDIYAEAKSLTPDQGGHATTGDFFDAVRDRLG